MKYYEVEFTLQPCTQDARDILSAMAGEAAFESFEDTDDGLTGYVQQQLFDPDALKQVVEDFPIGNVHIIYKVREAEDRDWNQAWEEQGFDPIMVGQQLTIHDGRHLPEVATPLNIEIDAHMAFGTGTHETTRMVCQALLEYGAGRDAAATATSGPVACLSGKHVLDCGCGTGILGITALLLGADSCTAYDIDEWSVDNTRHNSVINRVDERMTILHGDATILDSIRQLFDVVMANINRNILLQDMERFVSVMAPGDTLLLSGFYQEDINTLTDKAASLGLTLQQSRHDGDWACLTFVKSQYS